MKRCPECRRDYYDDTLSFCLNDGMELVYGLSPDEPATALIPEIPIDQDSAASIPVIESGTSIAVLPFVNMSADAEN